MTGEGGETVETNPPNTTLKTTPPWAFHLRVIFTLLPLPRIVVRGFGVRMQLEGCALWEGRFRFSDEMRRY